jgi:hypothetical protein
MDAAFSPGADLWVLPDIEGSPWRWSLEWSVNFQISKILGHPSPKISAPGLEQIKHFEAAEFIDKEAVPSSPWTLIAAEGLLPAKWLVFCGPVEKALLEKEVDLLWEGLGRPSVRFFPSKTWTTASLKSLKSKCSHASTTEILHES